MAFELCGVLWLVRWGALLSAQSAHFKAAFATSGRTYASRRWSTAWHARGIILGLHRVRSLMRANQLRSVLQCKFIHAADVADDTINFYNAVRLHSTLGNLSPIALEYQLTSKKLIEVSEIT